MSTANMPQQLELPLYPRWIVKYATNKWTRNVLGKKVRAQNYWSEDVCYAPNAQDAADQIEARHKNMRAQVISVTNATNKLDDPLN